MMDGSLNYTYGLVPIKAAHNEIDNILYIEYNNILGKMCAHQNEVNVCYDRQIKE
jgi:hypothetical protein